MSLLLHCPRCGCTYVRPREHLGQTITCSRCKCEFTVEPAFPKSEPPLPTFAPIIISAFPGDILIEPEPKPEPVHEVEHIEVLEEPPPLAEPAEPPGIGSLELGPATATIAVDDVEVVEPPARPREKQSVFVVPEEDIVLEPAAPPSSPQPVVDQVEVIGEPILSAVDQGLQAVPIVVAEPVERVEVFTEESQEDRLPPVRRRPQRPSLDIKKRTPRNDGIPAGFWIGLGAGVVGVAVLIVIIVVAMRSGSPNAAAPPQPPQDQPPPAAARPVEHYLPAKDEWPPPPDRRGPAPWKPTAPTRKAQIPSAKDLAGLVGYWPLDEGHGEQTVDASGQDHKTTLVGGWWIDGVRGKAVLFDGRRDYLDLGAGAQLNFPVEGSFTVAAWMATRQQDGYLLAFRNPRELAPMIQLKLNGGSLCGVVRADGSEVGEARVGLAPAADGRWHHFALVRHGGGMIECILDGQSLGKRTGDNTQGPITTTLRTIGCERSWYLSQRNPAAYCACAIDELCIFSRALTQLEIASLAGR